MHFAETAKRDFFDHHLRVNAAGVYDEYTNILFTNSATMTVNGVTFPNATPVNVGGRTLANARITWKSMSQDWEAAVGVTNLSDHFHYINKVFCAAPTNVTEGQPGAPREWLVSLKRNFQAALGVVDW